MTRRTVVLTPTREEAAVPALVTLDLWGVPPRSVPAAVLRIALDRRHVRRAEGLAFGKLLGTGDGRTFTLRDADPLHWGLLAVWRSRADAAVFERSATIRGWGRIAAERFRAELAPLSARGRWSGREPFGAQPPLDGSGAAGRDRGPVAAITRARLAPRRAGSFWRAVPPVSADLRAVPGLAFAVGIGEAPIGLQGTFSVWSDAPALREFAYRRAAHREVVRRTAEEGWYAEELFARFALLDAWGTFAGRDPLAGL